MIIELDLCTIDDFVDQQDYVDFSLLLRKTLKIYIDSTEVFINYDMSSNAIRFFSCDELQFDVYKSCIEKIIPVCIALYLLKKQPNFIPVQHLI